MILEILIYIVLIGASIAGAVILFKGPSDKAVKEAERNYENAPTESGFYKRENARVDYRSTKDSYKSGGIVLAVLASFVLLIVAFRVLYKLSV
jgi:hypothetical protein